MISQVPLTDCEVMLEYIDSAGDGDHALLATERYKPPQPLPPGARRRLPLNISGSGLGVYMPPHAMVGRSVLLVRASVHCAEPTAHATNVYTFGVDAQPGPTPTSTPATYRKFPGLIPVHRTNFTDFLHGHAACEITCSNRSACVGYTTDQTPSNCWLYDSVTALAPSAPDAFYLKPGLPLPKHLPVIPTPPVRVPPLSPIVNASATNLQIELQANELASLLANQRPGSVIVPVARPTIAFSLTNTGDHVALFARLAIRETLGGAELPFTVFSENFMCVLPGESHNVTGIFLDSNDRMGDKKKDVCVEAWNAPTHCVAASEI